MLCHCFIYTLGLGLLSFQVLESNQFKILYPKRHHEEAIKMLHSFENAYTQLATRFNRTDEQKIVLILEDHGLYANGSVSSQYKQIRLFRYYSTHDYYNLSHHNWYDSLAMHELVHYFQFYQSSGVLTLGQSLFGRYFNPNTVVPSSLTEGLAVYYESQISPYSGRLNDGYAHAIATTQKAHQTLPKLGHLHFQTAHYPFANWYLYGGLLVHQLDKKNNISRYHEALQYHANYSPSLVLGYTVPSLGIDQALQQKDLGSYSTLYSQWIDSIPENTKPKSTPLFSSSHNSFSKLVPYKKGFIVNQYKRPYHHSLGQSASNQFLYFKTPDSQPINILSELGLLLTDIHIIGDYLYYAVSTPEDGYANYSNKGTGYEAALIRFHIPTQTRTIVFKKAISSFSIDEHHHIWYWKVSRNTHESTLYKFDGNTHSELFTMPLIVHESDQNKKELYLSAKTEDSSLDIYRFVKNTKQLSPLFKLHTQNMTFWLKITRYILRQTTIKLTNVMLIYFKTTLSLSSNWSIIVDLD